MMFPSAPDAVPSQAAWWPVPSVFTDIDPLRYGLFFERFLNPDRISMPDIDIDFCQERRGEIIKYVTEKYGKDKVTQICTFGKMMAKGVIRDVDAP